MTYSDLYSDFYDGDGGTGTALPAVSVSISVTGSLAVGFTGTTSRSTAVAITAAGSLAVVGFNGTAARATTLAITAAGNVSAGLNVGSAESRLRAFLPNGADQGPLPGPESVNASYVLNDVGALTFAYASQAPRSSLLGQPLEVAVEVSTDSGLTWVEPPNSRFVYVSDGRNPLDPSDRYQVDCKSYVSLLSGSVVLPNGLLNTAGQRAFLSSNVGTILKTLLNEDQGAGGLPGLVHSSFGIATDTAGAAWNKTLTIYYEPGLDYLTVLLNLAEQGFCDFRMQGRSLQVYNPDTALAVDRTVGSPQVTLRAGRDLTEAPFRRTWEGLADTAFVAGGEGATYQTNNPAAVKPWGRRVVFISNGSVTDNGTMAALAQAQLALGNDARIEHTRGLDFTRATERPFTHYGVGDYVWSAVNGSAPERLRVRQITLGNDERNRLSGNVVLNDRFLEADVRQQRRINGITNGASSGTGTGGPVPTADSKAPAQVTGLAGSSLAYMGPGGFAQAQVSLSWTPVTTNSDGTAASDIDHYEVFHRLFGSAVGSERQFRTTSDTDLDNSPYQVGSNWWFRVRAVDTSGNRGAKSIEVAVGMASDATPPQAPSTPTVVAKLGLLQIEWDGLPATGTWPADFDHVDVHTSTTNSFTPSTATKFDTLYGAGATVVADGVYGIPLYVKLIALDRSGNASVASAQATGTPVQLVNTDLIDDIVTARLLADDAVTSAAIADLAVGTANMIDLSVVTAKIGNLAVNDAKIANLDVGKLTAGTLSASVLIAGSIKTATAGARVEMTSTGIRLFDAANINSVEISATSQYLRLRGTGDVSATSTGHALQIGPSNSYNTRFDTNEIGAYFNGVPASIAINLNGEDVHMASCVKARRFGAGTGVGGIVSDDADVGIVFVSDAASVRAMEARIVNGANSAYRDFVCASLLEASSSERKTAREDFDPISIIAKAPSQRWQYRPGFAVDGQWHYGPMADDLPELRIGEGAEMALSVNSLTGVLWEAVRRLLGRVEALER